MGRIRECEGYPPLEFWSSIADRWLLCLLLRARVLSGRPFAGGEQQDRIYGTVPVPLRPTNRAGALLSWSVVDDAPAAEAVGELEGVTLRLHLKDWSPPVRTHSSLRKRSAADLSDLSTATQRPFRSFSSEW